MNVRAHLGRKRCLGHAVTARAGENRHLVLRHLQPGFKQIEHLPPLNRGCHRGHEGCLTMLAALDFMAFDLVRLGDRAQCVSHAFRYLGVTN